MKEEDFVRLWSQESPSYLAWGKFIVSKINEKIDSLGIDRSIFYKIEPSVRLKELGSLVDKAFYRDKNYSDPYKKIEDKVGVRFVVLVNADVLRIGEIVEASDLWVFDKCRSFIEERDKNPSIFAYQSIHYVLRPTNEYVFDGVVVNKDTPCELQIRTLLQHAHSELTHDEIYKAKKPVQSIVEREVAKSMALIETTDDIFSRVIDAMAKANDVQTRIHERLDELYLAKIGKPEFHKSSITIYDTYSFVIENLDVNEIVGFFDKNPDYYGMIQRASSISWMILAKQSIVFFLVWMLINRKSKLKNNWPLEQGLLDRLATHFGVSIN